MPIYLNDFWIRMSRSSRLDIVPPPLLLAQPFSIMLSYLWWHFVHKGIQSSRSRLYSPLIFAHSKRLEVWVRSFWQKEALPL